PEDPLVIGGSTASPRPRREGVEERAAGLDGPLRALTERPFELAHEVLRFSPCRVGARPAECALDELESRVDPARRPRRAHRRQAHERLVVDVDHVARDRDRVVAREEIEAHGPSDHERKGAAPRHVGRSFFGAARDDANGLGADASFAIAAAIAPTVAGDADEVAARRAAADAYA